jgi:hypothetical protein
MPNRLKKTYTLNSCNTLTLVHIPHFHNFIKRKSAIRHTNTKYCKTSTTLLKLVPIHITLTMQ